MPGKIVSRSEWLEARTDLLAKEKAAVRANDAFRAQLRDDFPMVKIDKEYTFDGPNGKVALADLFDDRKQLIVYHFMLAPEDEAGCPGCSFLADNLPSSLTHLNSRNTTLVLVSRAPLEKIESFKKRMGWNYPWFSSFGTDFNYDFHVTMDEDVAPLSYNYKDKEALKKEKNPILKGDGPGLSIFLKEGNEVFHTYSTYARGLDGLLVTYKLLELTPLGRQDEEENGEWKRHDEYTGDLGKCKACH